MNEAPLPTTPVVKKPVSKLAVAGLILSLLGVCFFPLLLVAIPLSLAGLMKSGSKGERSGQGLAIAGLVVGVAGIFITGALAAIAIPNFLKYQVKAKQAECKANLKAAYTAERAFFQEMDRFSEDFREIGFVPERGNRYAYYLSASGTLEDRSGPTASPPDGKLAGFGVDSYKHAGARPVAYRPEALPAGVRVGLQGECPDCAVTIACVGQIDDDPTEDIWSISTVDRDGPDGSSIAAGALFQHVDDANE